MNNLMIPTKPSDRAGDRVNLFLDAPEGLTLTEQHIGGTRILDQCRWMLLDVRTGGALHGHC